LRSNVILPERQIETPREIELAGLGSPAARAAAHALGITLCDFRAL